MTKVREIWKEIDGYKERYKISSLGRVKSINPQNHREDLILLKPSLTTKGYYKVSLFNNGKEWQPSIHRLVAKAFIPNPENKPCVNHINGIKTDNRVENLEWCTHSENLRHAVDNGLKKGTPRKLTAEQVRLIKNISGMSLQKIANLFGVCPQMISKIKNGLNWSNIHTEPSSALNAKP